MKGKFKGSSEAIMALNFSSYAIKASFPRPSHNYHEFLIMYDNVRTIGTLRKGQQKSLHLKKVKLCILYKETSSLRVESTLKTVCTYICACVVSFDNLQISIITYECKCVCVLWICKLCTFHLY